MAIKKIIYLYKMNLSNILGSTIENYLDNDTNKKNKPISFYFINVIVFVIMLVIVAFFGKYLWNNFLAGAEKGEGYFTFIKPVPSLFHVIVLYIAIGLFFRG